MYALAVFNILNASVDASELSCLSGCVKTDNFLNASRAAMSPFPSLDKSPSFGGLIAHNSGFLAPTRSQIFAGGAPKDICLLTSLRDAKSASQTFTDLPVLFSHASFS